MIECPRHHFAFRIGTKNSASFSLQRRNSPESHRPFNSKKSRAKQKRMESDGARALKRECSERFRDGGATAPSRGRGIFQQENIRDTPRLCEALAELLELAHCSSVS
ncbi:MAG: hypothetical protein CO183_01685 [Candidatus Zambryskibacteria bacterium CG_4_9_14_3_um_filter_42_9]|nr:MAG: hypothetical protein CO183_01685 [Candidatus Zambryskibacteria bacterium CG_4_9_14_3_um_filter_42_9]